MLGMLEHHSEFPLLIFVLVKVPGMSGGHSGLGWERRRCDWLKTPRCVQLLEVRFRTGGSWYYGLNCLRWDCELGDICVNLNG